MTQFNVTVVDASGRGGGYTSALATSALAAGSYWAGFLVGLGTIDIQITIQDVPSNRADGTSAVVALSSINGAYSIYQMGAAAETLNGVDPNGGSPDILIRVDPDYLATQLWFDPNPSARTAAMPNNRVDAVSVMMHEIGHGLVFNGWRDGTNGALPGMYMSTFDQNVTYSAGHLYFSGANAVAVYGAPVPLTDGNYGHYGNSFALPSQDLAAGLMDGVVYYYGTRYVISELDLAIFKDSGLQVVTERDDVLVGFAISDTINGRGGNDDISGAGGNDNLRGDAGNDTLRGEDGDDRLDGGAGSDAMYGGNGNDTYVYDGADTILDVGSDTGDTIEAYANIIIGTSGVENVTLLGSAASATGSGANNRLVGNALANTLDGGDGADSLYGGAGNDTLTGGLGNDDMHGDFGADIYSVDSASDIVAEESVNILWRNKLSGENHVWGANGITVANGIDLNVAYVPLGWEIVGTADFNRDGTSDILWRNGQTGENHLWHMTGTSPSGVNLSVPVIPLAWKIVATADFDSDGYADILWRNSATGENHLWHMNDATVMSGNNLSRAVIPLDWDVVGAADFNNDGHTDILWRNKFTGENHLWYMNDTNFVSGVNLSVPVIPLAWQIQALTDFNADGHVDILWRNGQTGENHAWYMNDATVTAGYNLSIATVPLDWEIVGATSDGTWGGSDLINSSVNYTASDEIENLTLTGSAATGTGNDRANQITGNAAANTLSGLGGNDTIIGNGGADTMTGGTGADRFVWTSAAQGQDTITDFQAGSDFLDLAAVFAGQSVNAGNMALYVGYAVVGSDTLVSVDSDGAGASAPVALVTLTGVSGLDPVTMLQNGHLIVS